MASKIVDPSHALLDSIILLITRGVESNQPSLIQRAIKLNVNVRKSVSKPSLAYIIHKSIPPQHPFIGTLNEAVSKLPNVEAASSSAEDSEMQVQEETVADVVVEAIPTTILPEVEVYIFTLVVSSVLQCGLNAEAAYYSTILVNRIRTFNRRTLDSISSKAYFYYSLAHEKIDKLENIRAPLLAMYRTLCVHHDEAGQACLLNLLMRNYLHYNLVEQAQTLSEKAVFPEAVSNNQYCRYLYYMGRVLAVQLDYARSYGRLMMATRKAPQECGKGFVRQVHKLAILVQLLMGDMPDRAIFNQPELRQSLLPYLHLTQAVRNGDLPEFERVTAEYGGAFKSDKNFSLVRRLGHNVLKTGLRKISISYSKISLEDVAAKLHLPSAAAAEFVCAKAIVDGVMEGVIDHENGHLSTSSVSDAYATEDPQKQFHRRTVFCLDIHNESVKALKYPSAESLAASKGAAAKDKDAKDDENKPGKDDKTLDDLIKEMQDEMEEE